MCVGGGRPLDHVRPLGRTQAPPRDRPAYLSSGGFSNYWARPRLAAGGGREAYLRTAQKLPSPKVRGARALCACARARACRPPPPPPRPLLQVYRRSGGRASPAVAALSGLPSSCYGGASVPRGRHLLRRALRRGPRSAAQ